MYSMFNFRRNTWDANVLSGKTYEQMGTDQDVQPKAMSLMIDKDELYFKLEQID